MLLLDAAIKAAGFSEEEYREVSDAIMDGRVSVNGAIYTNPDFEVSPGSLVRYNSSDWSRVFVVPLP